MQASAGSPAWLMFARMFMLRAMNHGVEQVLNTDRKETHWGKRKPERWLLDDPLQPLLRHKTRRA
jgi:hypothetical protein